jgi:metal-sulfur cluster biosynthetic enzyme
VSADEATVRTRALEAINRVTDPCSEVAGVPAGLVDMGLVSSLALTPAADDQGMRFDIDLRIGLTEPSCLMGASFLPRLREALTAMEEVHHVHVGLDPDYVWSAASMSASLRERLAQRQSAQTRPLQFRAPQDR